MAHLIFGCGYLGSRVARRWLEAGETVYAVTRSGDRAAQLREAGLSPIMADVTQRGTLAGLPAADTALFAVGFDRSSQQSIESVYVNGFRNVLDALPDDVRRVIYISSTGVYGDFAGAWIDEDSPCHPSRPGGKASLAAEEVLWRHAFAARGVVLRLAGIYGPGRIPNRAPLSAGEPIAVPTEGFLNLIHVDDAAAVVIAAATAEINLPRRYVVSDGRPVRRRDYYAELAHLLHAPPPRFIEPPAEDARAARAAADKRVRNARMLAELPVKLAYPSFREGLAAILATESNA